MVHLLISKGFKALTEVQSGKLGENAKMRIGNLIKVL